MEKKGEIDMVLRKREFSSYRKRTFELQTSDDIDTAIEDAIKQMILEEFHAATTPKYQVNSKPYIVLANLYHVKGSFNDEIFVLERFLCISSYVLTNNSFYYDLIERYMIISNRQAYPIPKRLLRRFVEVENN